MYKIRIDPTYVHVHPMNRDGVGVYHRDGGIAVRHSRCSTQMVLCPLYAANC